MALRWPLNGIGGLILLSFTPALPGRTFFAPRQWCLQYGAALLYSSCLHPAIQEMRLSSEEPSEFQHGTFRGLDRGEAPLPWGREGQEGSHIGLFGKQRSWGTFLLWEGGRGRQKA